MTLKPLNLFYAEPDPDRWIRFDRYPRKLIRRIIRGKHKPGGVMMVAINLMRGLDKLGVTYRFNDHKYIEQNPEEIACIIGKPNVLFERHWKNPVILGAGIFSHPIEYPDLLNKYPNVKQLLVPGDWMEKMFIPYYGDIVSAWPTGIDTEEWKPMIGDKRFDFLIYNKIRWEHEKYSDELINPISQIVQQKGFTYQTIKYGSYTHSELKSKLADSKAVIFLCEHESQGLAYQQILATDTPILAWDRGGEWQDPYYYPHKVKYQPVSSVPYWDERCGMKFKDVSEFEQVISAFAQTLVNFEPRDYIMQNLTLELCAQKYLTIYEKVQAEINR